MAHTYRAEAHIAAEPEAVMAVLRDLPRYGVWNPMVPAVTSRLEVGSPVRMQVVLGPLTVRQVEWVAEVAPRRLVWEIRGWQRLFVHARRVQVVQSAGEGSHYLSEDTIGGPFGWLVNALLGRWVDEGFRAMAVALKGEVARRRAAAGERPGPP